MSHEFYVTVSYIVTFGITAVVIALTLADGAARRRELKDLEARGIRRRSERKEGQP